MQKFEKDVGDVDEAYEIFPALDSSDMPIVIDTQEVEEIGEPVMFLLEDSLGEKRVIALSSLIELVKVAQDLGRIPELPQEWYNCIIRENYDEV